VKLGPVLMTFEGIANFIEISEEQHRTRVEARGSDKKGRGTAHANVVMQLTPNGASTAVSIVTDLQLAGSVAQYGRASGLLAEVSRHLVDDFSANLNKRIESAAAGAGRNHLESSLAPSPMRTAPISAWRIALRILANSIARLFRGNSGTT